MNREQMIDAIAAKTKETKKTTARVLDAFFEITSKSLKKGEKVKWVGFGTFSVYKRAARKGWDPHNGKMIKVRAKRVAKFKAGAYLAARVI